MRKALMLLSASASLFLFSCQKEITLDLPQNSTGGNNAGGNGQLLGEWNFVYMRAITFSANVTNDPGLVTRVETTSDYTTINNSGTITFSPQTLVTTNVGYTVNTLAFSKMYENGVLIDTFFYPMVATVSPVSSQATYNSISADSIVIHGGTQTIGGVTQPSGPQGAKLRFSNDTLYMTQRVNENQVGNVQGQVVNMTRIAEVITVMKKK